MASAGYAGVFILMVLESATLPVPSEVVLPFAGYLTYLGQLNFWAVVVVATLGSLLGTTIDFGIGYYLGRPAVLRFGRYVRLNESHLVMIESWFKRRGSFAVFALRFVPLARTLVAFPAGVGKMNVAKFLLYSSVGIFLWDLALVYVGWLFGNSSTAIISSLYQDFSYAEIVIVVVAAIVLLAYFGLRRNRGRSGTRTSKVKQELEGKEGANGGQRD